jgi:hypothetical protein
LYSLPREGSCPECGHSYKPRKDDAKPKNPNRQLAQFRRHLNHRQRELRWAPAYWAFASAAVTACIMFNAGKGWWALTACAVVFAAGNHLNAWIMYHETKRKMEAIDASAKVKNTAQAS